MTGLDTKRGAICNIRGAKGNNRRGDTAESSSKKERKERGAVGRSTTKKNGDRVRAELLSYGEGGDVKPSEKETHQNENKTEKTKRKRIRPGVSRQDGKGRRKRGQCGAGAEGRGSTDGKRMRKSRLENREHPKAPQKYHFEEEKRKKPHAFSHNLVEKEEYR